MDLELENEFLREENENLKAVVKLLHDEHFGENGGEYIYEPKQLQREFTIVRESTSLAHKHERAIVRQELAHLNEHQELVELQLMEVQTELEESKKALEKADEKNYKLQLELEKLRKMNVQSSNKQFEKMKNQNEKNAEKIKQQEAEILKMKKHVKMMKIKEISEDAENAEKEEKAEAYISTLKNEINILQNELEMMKLQAEINENSSSQNSAEKNEDQEEEIKKLNLQIEKMREEAIQIEMEDKTELENLKAEKLRLELLQEEKDGNLKNLKKKIKELEEELRILKSTNTKQEKKFKMNFTELKNIKIEKDEFKAKLEEFKKDMAQKDTVQQSTEQNQLQSLQQENARKSAKLKFQQDEIAKINSQNILANAEIQKLAAENAELAEQVNFAEQNEKIVYELENKLHLANRELEKCKGALHWYQNPAIYAEKIRRFEKENGFRKPRHSENLPKNSNFPNSTTPLAPISEKSSKNEIRRISGNF